MDELLAHGDSFLDTSSSEIADDGSFVAQLE